MMDNKIITKLNAKKAQLEASLHEKDNCVWMARKEHFSWLRRVSDINRKIAAIDLAIDIITKSIGMIDLYKYVLLIVSDNLAVKSDLFQESESIYLNERKNCASYLIENYLCVRKKQVLEYI